MFDSAYTMPQRCERLTNVSTQHHANAIQPDAIPSRLNKPDSNWIQLCAGGGFSRGYLTITISRLGSVVVTSRNPNFIAPQAGIFEYQLTAKEIGRLQSRIQHLVAPEPKTPRNEAQPDREFVECYISAENGEQRRIVAPVGDGSARSIADLLDVSNPVRWRGSIITAARKAVRNQTGNLTFRVKLSDPSPAVGQRVEVRLQITNSGRIPLCLPFIHDDKQYWSRISLEERQRSPDTKRREWVLLLGTSLPEVFKLTAQDKLQPGETIEGAMGEFTVNRPISKRLYILLLCGPIGDRKCVEGSSARILWGRFEAAQRLSESKPQRSDGKTTGDF